MWDVRKTIWGKKSMKILSSISMTQFRGSNLLFDPTGPHIDKSGFEQFLDPSLM